MDVEMGAIPRSASETKIRLISFLNCLLLDKSIIMNPITRRIQPNVFICKPTRMIDESARSVRDVE